MQRIFDSFNGQLRFTNDFSVSPQSTQDEIVQHFGRENIDIRHAFVEWTYYSVRNVKINDTYFVIRFDFANDVLKKFSFNLDDKIIVEEYSWSNLSEIKELQKRDYYNNWLTREIGENRQFIWGTIVSVYENLVGVSYILVEYN